MNSPIQSNERLGLLAVAAVSLILIVLSNNLLSNLRIDLTENQLYTLSDGTREILATLDEPINLYFFFSRSASEDLPYLKTYGTRIEEMLAEFQLYSNGNLNVTVIDPEPFSEEEDRAAGFGLEGVSVGLGTDNIFFGLAGTNAIGDEEIINVFDPNKESFLEYDLTKLVYNLANPTKPVIGVLSTLPIMGGMDPMTRQPQPRWAFLSQLDPVAEVRQISPDVTSIAEDVEVLMIVHPKDLSEPTQYAIDQFILGGGRAIIFVDPWSEAEGGQNPNNPTMQQSRSSNLNALFNPWGIQVPVDDIVGDDGYALQVSGPSGRPVRHLALLGLRDSAFNRDNVITANLETVNLGFVGRIVSDEQPAVTISPLLQSSELAALLPAELLGMTQDPTMLQAGFTPTGENYVLAAQLSGSVSSAFPAAPAGAETGQAHIAESVEPINVVVVADTDLLMDNFWVRTQSFFGQQIATAFANNGALVANSFDTLRGSNALIGIRGRPSFSRPFERVNELRREAEKQFRIQEQQLQQQLSDTETRLAELQSRSEGDSLMLSGELQAELDRFRAERLGIRKQLRQVQRNLDREIERLGLTLKAINIALIPALLTLIAIAGLLWRRRHGGRS